MTGDATVGETHQQFPLELVLFDLDDTLFAHRLAVDTGVAAHLKSLGGALAAADATAELLRWHTLEELHYHRYLSGELDFLGQRRARSRALLLPYGIDLVSDLDADAWFDAYLVHYKGAWTLHPDTLPCLDRLKTMPLHLGIITNGEIEFQQDKVTTAGLAPYFEEVIASGSLGFTKPDARIFHFACERFGADPAAAMYVGDRFSTDAVGAADAGLTGVWIDRTGVATEGESASAAHSGINIITSLAELPPLVSARRQ